MSSTISSLFGGTAPPNVATSGSTVSGVPSWLLNSTNSVVGQANSVASQPYQAYQGPQVAPWTADQNAAQQTVDNLQGAYQPTLNQATNLATASANPSQFATANNTLGQAANTIQGSLAPTQAQMNPYINNVIQANNLNTAQYLQNTAMPTVNSQFTANGNFGSAANQRAAGLTSNQLTENLNAQNQSALAGAYSNAQSAGLAGGQALGNLGQIQGGLGYEQGSLGQSAATNLGNLATTGQSLGLQGAGTQYNVGAAQQAQGQQNLTTAYNNFENQTYYPQNQLSWLSGIINGSGATAGSASSTAASAPLSGSTYGASPFATGVGIYNGLNSLGGSSS